MALTAQQAKNAVQALIDNNEESKVRNGDKAVLQRHGSTARVRR